MRKGQGFKQAIISLMRMPDTANGIVKTRHASSLQFYIHLYILTEISYHLIALNCSWIYSQKLIINLPPCQSLHLTPDFAGYDNRQNIKIKNGKNFIYFWSKL